MTFIDFDFSDLQNKTLYDIVIDEENWKNASLIAQLKEVVTTNSSPYDVHCIYDTEKNEARVSFN